MYGHYSSCHFKDQLIERIGAERKFCEEHKVILEGKGHIAAHFGRVHNMVEEFLPSRYHISLKSQRRCATRAKNAGQYETTLEKIEKYAKTDNEDHTCCVNETKDTYLPNPSFDRESKIGSIELGLTSYSSTHSFDSVHKRGSIELAPKREAKEVR